MSFEQWMGEYPRCNVGWTLEEELELMNAFNDNARLEYLCKIHGRRTGEIERRLKKMLGTNFALQAEERRKAEEAQSPEKLLERVEQLERRTIELERYASRLAEEETARWVARTGRNYVKY